MNRYAVAHLSLSKPTTVYVVYAITEFAARNTVQDYAITHKRWLPGDATSATPAGTWDYLTCDIKNDPTDTSKTYEGRTVFG